MKAAVHRNGSVDIADLEIPAPGDGEVLVRVHATTICAADYRGAGVARMGGWVLRKVYGRPVVFGMEMSGTVEATGKTATRFRPGDLVFGASGFRFGCHAEYACAREFALERKPANMTLEEAATIPFGATTALCNLRWARVEAGQNILIYGASGSVGVWAVQLAKHLGARVTAVCSTANVEMVKSLGADVVLDYTKEDFSKDGQVFDAIIDTVGKSGFRRSMRALKRGRPYARIAPSNGIPSIALDVPRQWWLSMTGAAKVVGGVTKPEKGDLALFKTLIEEGQLKTVVDRRYPFAKIADAFHYAGRGHKKGHVVIGLVVS